MDEGWRQEFERIGDAGVADRLAQEGWNATVRPLAVGWLAERRQTREAAEDLRSEASQAESLRIARSAKNAAWAAAIAAMIAVPIAIASIVIAYLSWAAPHR